MIRRALLGWMILQIVVLVSRAEILDAQLREWLNDSTLTFTGRITALEKSNVSGIDKSDGPMLVRVERVEASHPGALRKFGSLVGEELTVVINPSFKLRPTVRKNLSAVFFVDPLIYEAHIAVIANAFTSNERAANLSTRVRAAAEQNNQKPLKDAVTGADRVISGTVEEVKHLPDDKLAQLRTIANGRDLFSEHSPRWREARIRVQSILKGDPSEKAVLVVFPSTDDRLWAQSPKFKVGDKGIWLLHRGQLSEERSKVLFKSEAFDGGELSVYTALKPEDFQKDPSAKTAALIREWLRTPNP